ncbi:MAG: fibronectin type III domain-containing protein, partial [Deltaproteobacteria bacterium]|nr:fibronectin type III domain-containing protein [Deltaproteobacteria bacterium]
MGRFGIETRKWEVILPLLSAVVLLSNLIMQDGMLFAATGAWTSNGPEGGQIKALTIDPVTSANLYAGTYEWSVYSWTITAVPPPRPETVVPSPGNGQVTIGWSEVADATSYNLYYSTTPGVTKSTGTRITGVTRPSSVSPLVNGTPYYFVVTAVNAYGESAESDQVSAVPGVSSAAYTLADLAGNWEVNSLASGPGAPWWIRISLNIAADGSFSGTETDSDGSTGSTSGTLLISPNGIVTMAGNSIFQCSMDSGKTLLACTSTWSGTTSPGTSELILFTKKGSGYSSTDIVGDWWFSNLTTPGPYWERGSLTAGPSGAFSYTFIDSDGNPHTGSGTLSITSDGVLTPVGANISPTRCVMDSGKSANVCTSTSSSGTTGMQILTRKAANYALSDLAGTWGVNALVSGPGAPWWNRGSVTFVANGSYSGSLQDYDGSPPSNVTGVFGITADGVFTPDFNANEECHMDAGKTIMACTGTWTTGSPGSTELTVLTKSMVSAPATFRGLAITSGPASLYESNVATYAVSAYWSDATSSSVTPIWSVNPATYATINSSTGQLTTLAVPSNRTVTVSAVYSYNGITLTASKTVTIVNQTSALTMTLSGSGSGSINSNPAGMIACTYPPQTGTCLTSQPVGTALTLIATPAADSSFDSWGSACGSCTGLSCLLDIDSDKTCSAAFQILPLVRIAGPVYFASIIKAYDQLS